MCAAISILSRRQPNWLNDENNNNNKKYNIYPISFDGWVRDSASEAMIT